MSVEVNFRWRFWLWSRSTSFFASFASLMTSFTLLHAILTSIFAFWSSLPALVTDGFALMTLLALRYVRWRWSYILILHIILILYLEMDIIHMNSTIIDLVWLVFEGIEVFDKIPIAPVLTIVLNFFVWDLLFTLHTSPWMIELGGVLLLLLLVLVVQVLQQVLGGLLLLRVLSTAGGWSGFVDYLVW